MALHRQARLHTTRPVAGRTIVETLTVIGLILIVAGMVFPVYVNAMEGGKHRTCASNLKGFGRALSLYAQQYDDLLPPFTNDQTLLFQASSGGYSAPIAGEGNISTLRTLLRHFGVPRAAWYCPSDKYRRTDSMEMGIAHRLTSYRFLLVNLYPDVDERMFDPLNLIKLDPNTPIVMDAVGLPMVSQFSSDQGIGKPISNHPDGWVNFLRADMSVGQLSTAEVFDRGPNAGAFLRAPAPN